MPYYSAKPIHLSLRPSSALAGILGSAGFLTMVIPWLLPIPVVLKALLFLPVAVAAVHYIRRDALLSLPVSPARLDLNGQTEL